MILLSIVGLFGAAAGEDQLRTRALSLFVVGAASPWMAIGTMSVHGSPRLRT